MLYYRQDPYRSHQRLLDRCPRHNHYTPIHLTCARSRTSYTTLHTGAYYSVNCTIEHTTHRTNEHTPLTNYRKRVPIRAPIIHLICANFSLQTRPGESETFAMRYRFGLDLYAVPSMPTTYDGGENAYQQSPGSRRRKGGHARTRKMSGPSLSLFNALAHVRLLCISLLAMAKNQLPSAE